jgi:hypothetical protein
MLTIEQFLQHLEDEAAIRDLAARLPMLPHAEIT